MLRLALYQYDTKKKEALKCRYSVIEDLDEDVVIDYLDDFFADIRMKHIHLPMIIGDLVINDVPNLTLIKGGKDKSVP